MKLAHSVLLLFLFVPAMFCYASAQDTQQEPAVSASQKSSAPATAYTLPPDKLAKAKALYDLHGKLNILGTIWSFVVLLALLYWGVAARYRNWAESTSRWSFVQALIAVPLLLLTLDLLDLPLEIYSHHVSLQYGLSVQRWGSWFGDVLKGEALTLLGGAVLLWLMVLVIRKSPRLWWFWFWFPAFGLLCLFVFGAPLAIDPLFNKFEPLEQTNPRLVTSIEGLAHRAGVDIPRSRIFEMKASEKTPQLNAYVTGYGASKRIVIWDTTIQKITPQETLFIVGHEMGHYVLNHIIYGLVLGGLGLFAALWLLYLFSGWMLQRFQQRWHIHHLGDWAALPMIFLILGIFAFFSAPIDNTISRQFEHNADIYGLEVTHGINPDAQEAAAHSFQVLGEISLVYPTPNRLLVFWYYDHPPISDRVRFAHEYDPWSRGEQPKYVK
jgi:Zn-dependent protease with chaperone function